MEKVSREDFETESLKIEEGTESVPAQELWTSDFSEQVNKYRENKPSKTKDVTSREF